MGQAQSLCVPHHLPARWPESDRCVHACLAVRQGGLWKAKTEAHLTVGTCWPRACSGLPSLSPAFPRPELSSFLPNITWLQNPAPPALHPSTANMSTFLSDRHCLLQGTLFLVTLPDCTLVVVGRESDSPCQSS